MLTRALCLSLLLFVCAASAVGCEKASEAPAEKAKGEDPKAQSQPPDDTEPEKTSAPTLDVVGMLAAAGYSVDPEVPFDDMGELDERFTSGSADGQTAYESWVLKSGDKWIQVAAGTFESEAAAKAAAGTGIVRGNMVLHVVAVTDDSPVADVTSVLTK